MKIFKKGLLAVLVSATLPLIAADSVDDLTIYVTTFNDENGENEDHCSLREAIKTSELNQAFGGCNVGSIKVYDRDTIQLKTGVYQLNSTLTPKSDVEIIGVSLQDWSQKDPVTLKYPAPKAISTVIQGKQAFTLIDTTEKRNNLKLSNLHLTKGHSQTSGGAIRAGSQITLDHVTISQSSAANEGGAVYLEGLNSNLIASYSLFQSNKAPVGAVLSMSCVDSLDFTPRASTTINQSSIISNGDSATTSILKYCGYVNNAQLESNTIAKNTASSTQGSIIQFTANNLKNANSSPILSTNSAITIKSNTIVENTAWASFLYDYVGSNKRLRYNVLAFNEGRSCRYLVGNVADIESKQDANGDPIYMTGTGLYFNSNAVNTQNASRSDFCDLPAKVTEVANHQEVGSINRSQVLSSMQSANAFNRFLPLYYPLNTTATYSLLNLDNGSNDCSANDQRGISRSVGSILSQSDSANYCDIGAVEFMTLSASDAKAISNVSFVGRQQQLQGYVDRADEIIGDPTDEERERLNDYKEARDYYQKKLVALNANPRYRQIYFDVFALSTPEEFKTSQGSQFYEFNNSNYKIEVLKKGRGGSNVFSNSAYLAQLEDDANLYCSWDSALEELVMYRTNNTTTAAGDYEYCQYRISLKSDPSVQSTGLIQASFRNIAPIAEDDNYTIDYSKNNAPVTLNLLSNDNDDGDGIKTAANYPNNKSEFYQHTDATTGKTVDAPIQIIDGLHSGLILRAEHEAPCPGLEDSTCYGGEMSLEFRNSYSPFNEELTYQVYDNDGLVSNQASVKLTNTATTTDKPGSKSGGGSMSWFSVLILSLLAWRRYRRS